jgi:polyisoprenoid-binding protein YceI
MRCWREVSITRCLVFVIAVASFSASTLRSFAQAAPDLVLTLDPSQSQVHWDVDSTLHLVHGTFILKSGAVRLNPETGKADGEIVVSAQSGESGNGSRDKRMHKEILETAKYPDAVFRPAHFDGKLNPSGPSDVKLTGVFTIHGSDHQLTCQVHAEVLGDRWTATGKFEVPYVQWGIKDPSNFVLKVKPVVNVELDMAGVAKSAR